MLPAGPDIERIIASAGVEGAELVHAEVGTLVRIAASAARDLLAACREVGYGSLTDFDGVDTGEGIELTWRVRSYLHDRDLVVKATLPYGGTVESVWQVYPSALMPERETAELLGLHLAGHPNPKRLFTTEGIEPLLLRSVPIRTEEEYGR